MLVGELAKRARVRTGTINFYVQQGLLPRPRKVNRTRAYYDDRHLERLRIIKRLQAVHGLPLSLIKRLLRQAGSDEQLLRRLAAQRGPVFATDIVQLPESDSGDDAPQLTREQFRQESALHQHQLRNLEELGLIRARGEREMYGAAELQAAKSFRRLFELGAGPDELKLYQDYLNLQHWLAQRLFQHLLKSHRDDWRAQRLSGRELSEISGTIEAYLRYRAASDMFPSALQQLVPDLVLEPDQKKPSARCVGSRSTARANGRGTDTEA